MASPAMDAKAALRRRLKSKKRFAGSLSVSLAGASAGLASTDYGPAQSHIISCKYYTGGNGHHFCVIHDMEGYYLSTISYLSNCGNTVSRADSACVNRLESLPR